MAFGMGVRRDDEIKGGWLEERLGMGTGRRH